MTESPSTGSGQSSVLCPDGLLVYREILRPYNAVIQSVHNLHLLSIHIFQQYLKKNRFKIPEVFADEHSSQAILDFLTATDVERWVCYIGEWKMSGVKYWNRS